MTDSSELTYYPV